MNDTVTWVPRKVYVLYILEYNTLVSKELSLTFYIPVALAVAYL